MPRFVTVAETAEMLRLSVETIRNYCDDGRLPYVRFVPNGRSPRLIPSEAVEALIAAHTFPAATEGQSR